MLKRLLIRCAILVSFFSIGAKANCDISGIWNHSTKPATLLINMSTGEVSVASHEKNANAIGLTVLKNVEPTSNSSSWNGKMYSADDDSFVDVQITSENCRRLSVYFQDEKVLTLVR